MNKQRRSELKQAIYYLYDAIATIEAVADEEEEAFENIPENMQESERAEQMYCNVENMRDIMDGLLDYTTILEDM